MIDARAVRTGISVAAAADTINRVRRSSSDGHGASEISRGPSGCSIVAGWRSAPRGRGSALRPELACCLCRRLASIYDTPHRMAISSAGIPATPAEVA